MIGIDICKVERIKNIKNLSRIFHKQEIEYFEKKNNNLQTIAGFYSAKEAIMKVFDCCKSICFMDILIEHNQNGKPIAKLFNAPQKEFEEKGYKELEISISHDGEYACAVAQVK